MRVDFSAMLINFNGEPIRSDGEGAPPVTLGLVAMNALSIAKPDMPVAEKIRRGRLAERAYDGGECELSPEDITLIRAAIGESYPPVIVLKAFRLLGDEDAKILSMRAS